MKPNDIKAPFDWKNPHILIHDHIWFVPERCKEEQIFKFPGWSDPAIFSNDRPVKIEYCSGNGAWIAAQAEKDPDSNWVAVERRFLRLRKIWSKIKNLKIKNLLLVCGEGMRITEEFIPDASVSEVFINFPDPWPKRRHARLRIMQPAFIQEMARILKRGSYLNFVTDDVGYSTEVIDLLSTFPNYESVYPHPFYSTEELNYGSSFFEELWREKGREIRYHKYRLV